MIPESSSRYYAQRKYDLLAYFYQIFKQADRRLLGSCSNFGSLRTTDYYYNRSTPIKLIILAVCLLRTSSQFNVPFIVGAALVA